MADFSFAAFLLLTLVVLAGIAITSLLCVFLLIFHEYGHIAAMQRLDVKPSKVVIGWPVVFRVRIGGLQHEFGLLPVFGLAYADRLPTLGLPERALIAAAGPAMSIIVGFVLLVIASVLNNHFILMAGYGSLLIAALNLIPLPPMDGWPIAEYWLHKFGVVANEPVRRLLLGLGIFVIGLSSWALLEMDLFATTR